MQQWEYCYTSTLGNRDGAYILCDSYGESRKRVEACSRQSDARACVIAYLGSQGWEAFAHDSATTVLWFKRPK